MTSRHWVACMFFALAPRLAIGQVIENDSLRVEVSPQSGSIVRLFDRRNNMEYITHPDQARLFELLIPDATNYSRRIVSWTQQPASVKTIADRIEIRYQELQPDEEQYRFGSGLMNFPEPVLPIEALVTLQLQGDHVEAHMRITNHSPTTITGVVFPYVGGLQLESGGSPAAIVLPSLGKRRFQDTAGALSGQRTYRYPAVLASSWLNLEFAGKGLGVELRSGLESQDAYFSLSAGPFREGSAYRGRYAFPFIAWIHYPHLAANGEWISPSAILHVHDADWHTLAAEHREWFRGEHAPRPASQWMDVPGFATYHLKRDDNTINWSYADIPAVAAAAREAGMRRLVIEGWRKQEGLSNPAPFGELADPRLGGASGLRAVIEKLQGEGVELIFAFHPTLLNVLQGRPAPPLALWPVKTRRQGNQLPVDFLYHTADQPDSLTGPAYRVEIDPSSAASDFLVQEASRLREEYGIRNLLLKGIGQRAFLSYNRHHGIAPEAVYSTGYAGFLGALREIYPDGLLLNEGVNDLVDQYGDGAYTWNQSHDPQVLAFSLPWSTFSNDVEALDYAAANTAFAFKMLTNVIVDGGEGTVADYPEFAQHLRGLQELKAATRPYYAEAEFRDHDGLINVTSDPGAVVAVYLNPAASKAGILLVNVKDEPQVARFEPDSPLQGAKVRAFPDGTPMVDLSVPVEYPLTPYQVVVLGIDR